MKKIYIIAIVIFIVIIGGVFFIHKNNIENNVGNNEKQYREITAEEFKDIAKKNGYVFIENTDKIATEENALPKELSSITTGFYVDAEGAVQYKIEFYEFKKRNGIDKYYNYAIEVFRNWNDEERTQNEEIGSNYKKCEVINKYGYGVVVNVENSLFVAYGYEEELKKLVNDLYN